jgi:hypothetical protein
MLNNLNKEPAAVPNPEQTTSLISLLLWFFLDRIVLSAYRAPYLSYDQLPPLADYDLGKNLVKNSVPKLDPLSSGKKQHIFWGLLSVYRKCIIILLYSINCLGLELS